MSTAIRGSLLCAVAMLALACNDDSDGPVVVEPVVDAGTVPVPPPTTPAPDAGTPVENKPIPLILWVDDLVDHHTDDVSVPDTVDDKNIYDDENPTIFDSRFQ